MGKLGSVNLAATNLGEPQAQYVKFKMSTDFSNFSGWTCYMAWLRNGVLGELFSVCFVRCPLTFLTLLYLRPLFKFSQFP
ncbi:hypothetical protein L873DRAFT_1284302 [Choiromyces venosus 120613-1]|uniref:Uncharacterized protein n=1 Tax=Choiromyces venosus 120613-1 TaxID=1336337 RepID=A0A3N4JCE5_9PEZI|nr:hypothetical protein L873DRAFT_1284302 [Choiromyces venosus 120613-1]